MYQIHPILDGRYQTYDGENYLLGKDEFRKLYEIYFRGKNKPARTIYDKIFLSAKDKCPYCGLTGTPEVLDHYLPQEFFAQYAILPCNLIPVCGRCNGPNGKLAIYASKEEEQIIHPFLDKDIFFDEQWIKGKYIQDTNEISRIEYFVEPPPDWNQKDKERVKNHFDLFELGVRYAIHAAQELSNVEKLIDKLQSHGFSNKKIIEDFLDDGSFEKNPNNWKVVMYSSLINELSKNDCP